MEKICNFYSKYGYCKWGIECYFAHTGTRAPTQDNDSARVHSEEQTRDGHGSRESEESGHKRKLSEIIKHEEEALQAKKDLLQRLKRQKRFGLEVQLGGEPCPKKPDDAPPWWRKGTCTMQGYASSAHAMPRRKRKCPKQWDAVPWRNERRRAGITNIPEEDEEEEEEEEEYEEDQEEEEEDDEEAAAAEEDSEGRMFAISKEFCSILRHKAVSYGLKIQNDGFCELKEVLKLRTMRALGVSMIDVEQLMLLQEKNTNKKRRFEVQQRVHDGKKIIRALQGHSMQEVEDEALLEALSFTSPSLPVKCLHGTKNEHVMSIMQKGLIPGGQGKWSQSQPRSHIHFTPYDDFGKQKKNRAADLKNNICHGLREKYEAGILINMRKAMREGIKFFRSDNGAILTRGGQQGVLHPRYFTGILVSGTMYKLD